jgi:hypothetical protein
MMTLAARYASGWDGITGLRSDGQSSRTKLEEFPQTCKREVRDPSTIEIACTANMLVLRDHSAVQAMIDHIAAGPRR